ncbi:hypothetical protein [Spirosoma gilvum]
MNKETNPDYSKSGFWSLTLELSTNAERKDIPGCISGAEVVLDALQSLRRA